jgi:NAD(P)-dependent dehydrogenase (short-subunit alcohol dehydrogenase family)
VKKACLQAAQQAGSSIQVEVLPLDLTGPFQQLEAAAAAADSAFGGRGVDYLLHNAGRVRLEVEGDELQTPLVSGVGTGWVLQCPRVVRAAGGLTTSLDCTPNAYMLPAYEHACKTYIPPQLQPIV